MEMYVVHSDVSIIFHIVCAVVKNLIKATDGDTPSIALHADEPRTGEGNLKKRTWIIRHVSLGMSNKIVPLLINFVYTYMLPLLAL